MKNIWKLLAYFIALIVIVGLEMVYGDPLFAYSISFQENLEQYKNSLLTYIFVTFSIVGDGGPYLLLCLLIFNWQGHAKGVYYFVFMSAQLFFQIFGKIIYAEPRPFMVSDIINPIGCSYEWGQPSGHSMMASGFALFIFMDYFHVNPTQWGAKKIGYLCLAIGYFIMVGFARIY